MDTDIDVPCESCMTYERPAEGAPQPASEVKPPSVALPKSPAVIIDLTRFRRARQRQERATHLALLALLLAAFIVGYLIATTPMERA